ncbi:cobalt-zinc-cadmium efflux system outer membrane protein [Pseudomonas duriflava]|uniref:Cobalt-zinc-cadmium efflux system outer membrane protein n=1 Tax=Pseudomonas duriflava TaxID=459528 RepID=A0A562PV44_9PSED|nr:TolC family protein [Pseudomonas duriflava]TWI48258.1 cobalt-zinc-cadmium efflux system outer membrane protein [Pseudomonas duriflava]
MRLVVFLICLGSTGFISAYAADPNHSLTLAQAISTAYEKNPGLSAAQWETGVAQGIHQQASLIPNPELAWDVEDTRSGSQINSITITQPFELGGKRQARMNVAEVGKSLASAEIVLKRNNLRADVIQAFYLALRAQEGLRLANESLQLAERAVTVAKSRVVAGKTSPVEETRAEVLLSSVRLEVRRAQLEQDNAYKQLASYLGSTYPTFTSVIGNLEYLPRLPQKAELLARIRNSPELYKARLQIDQSDAELNLQRTQRIPDLRVSIGSQYDEQERERVNLVGVSLPLPLFDRNQGNVLAASRQAGQAMDLRNATELRLISETQQAFEQWQAAQADLNEIRNAILPAGQSAVESATRGFAMGKFGFLDVLDAQRTLISARAQYLQSLADAIDAWVRIERIYGDTTSITDSQE